MDSLERDDGEVGNRRKNILMNIMTGGKIEDYKHHNVVGMNLSYV